MATVLVVDDYPVIQRILSLTLQINNHIVHTAGNGLEALELLSSTDVDLVITDVSMPEMDGLSLLGNIRNDIRYAELPVIILTAIGQEEVREVATLKGANGFLTKPTSSTELISAVTNLLQPE